MRFRKAASESSSDSDLPPSLAGTEIGDEVHVSRIVLNLVRVMCTDRGISVGDRLLVEDRSARDVVVRNEYGRPARLPHPYAFFVQVDPDDRAGHEQT